MPKQINIVELKSHLSEILAQISQTGEEVIIGKYGKPVAKIVPFTDRGNERKVGFGQHLMMSELAELQHQVDAPIDSETLDGFYQ